VVKDRPKLSVKYCLPVPVFYFLRKLERTLQRGLSAIAEHLVILHNKARQVIIKSIEYRSARNFRLRKKYKILKRSLIVKFIEFTC